MTFLLRVDGQRWQSNVDEVLAGGDDAAGGGMVVPVAKSNGYGLGQQLVARQMRDRQRRVLSVGTIYEALDQHLDWDADLLVLTPYNVAETAAETAWQRVRQRYGTRLITTVADTGSLRALAGAANRDRPTRVLLEALTAVRRFGFNQPELQAELRDPELTGAVASGALRLSGLALHLPMAAPSIARSEPTRHLGSEPPSGPVVAGSAKVQQAADWGAWWLAQLAPLSAHTGQDADFTSAAQVWVSHLSPAELRDLRAALPDVPVHPRTGTALWLGDLGSMQAFGTVLAVHPSAPGGAGYFQRRVPSGAHLVIVGGGTVHGVAMNAPIGAATVRRRITTVGYGVLDAAGMALSPFRWKGKRLRFHEAPHASVSLVLVPRSMSAPAVGDEMPCQVRFSTSQFDQVVGLG